MFENMGDTWVGAAGEIIIMLILAFVLGYLVKIFSGKEKEVIEDLESQLEIQSSRIESINRKLKKTQKENSDLTEENNRLLKQDSEIRES